MENLQTLYLTGKNIFCIEFSLLEKLYYCITQQYKQDTKALSLLESIPNDPSLSVIIPENQTHIDLAKYLHATCFSLVKTNFIKAIKTIISYHGLA